jgi:hypothetical protein
VALLADELGPRPDQVSSAHHSPLTHDR